ncbi:hypothetical protein AYI70_g9620 [Smittium culicis]|uniref:Uncharacterized protein n=1 Tax=Smittium culicis TaxID=133412 RepID=A0A1R1XAC4_9FUNG|nr:hypothetical protein AYI70_g9620 [Smittium culicis]
MSNVNSRIPTLQTPLKPAPTGPQTDNKIFAEGVAAAGEGLNRDPEQPPPPTPMARGFRIPFNNPKTPTSNPSSEKTEIEPRSPQGSDGGSRLSADKTCDRRNQTTKSCLLQPVVHDPQEDWGSPTCPRPPQAQPLRGGT